MILILFFFKICCVRIVIRSKQVNTCPIFNPGVGSDQRLFYHVMYLGCLSLVACLPASLSLVACLPASLGGYIERLVHNIQMILPPEGCMPSLTLESFHHDWGAFSFLSALLLNLASHLLEGLRN